MESTGFNRHLLLKDPHGITFQKTAFFIATAVKKYFEKHYPPRFEIFTVVAMKNAVFWDVLPRRSCKSHTASHPRRRHSSISTKFQRDICHVSHRTCCFTLIIIYWHFRCHQTEINKNILEKLMNLIHYFKLVTSEGNFLLQVSFFEI
jgi:hypothetical protein